jgi:hypothetical protein
MAMYYVAKNSLELTDAHLEAQDKANYEWAHLDKSPSPRALKTI